MVKHTHTVVLALWFTISPFFAALTSRAALIRYIVLTEWFGQEARASGNWYRRGKYFLLDGEPTDQW